jgi:branched-chain amino acid transport system permease protein
VFAFVVAFLVWALYKYVDDSVFGACCLATKMNEVKLKFLGYDDFRIRLLAFVIANTTTALAGSMYALHVGIVSPEIASPARAADPVVVTILGGVGTLYGPLVGAIAYTGMKDVISNIFGNWELVIGFMLVFIMLAGEKGIWGTLEPRLAKLFRRRRDAVTRDEPANAGF